MKRPEAPTATLSRQELERLWEEHLKGEFETKDVEATLATMVDDAHVNHMPVNTGGRGKDALRAFYRDDFIRSEEHTSELQSQSNLVCRLLLEKKKKIQHKTNTRPVHA